MGWDHVSPVRAVAVDLAAHTLRERGRIALRVTGTSMLPAVLPRDVVFVRNCGFDAVQRGELVLFRREHRLFVHRVIGHGPRGLVTQGDANPRPDAPVQPSEFLGRVVRQARNSRAFRPRHEMGGAARAAAALFRRSPHAANWFWRAHALLAPRA